MMLRFDILPKMFYAPRQAFKEIGDISMAEGLLMGVLLTIASTILGLLLLNVSTSYILFNLVMPPIGMLFMGGLSAQLAKGKKDHKKTIAFFGYAQVIPTTFTIAMILLYYPLLSMISGHSIEYMTFSGAGVAMIVPFLLGAMLGLASLFYNFWVYGTGIAVANDTTLGQGILSYLVAGIIWGAFLFGIIIGIRLTL